MFLSYSKTHSANSAFSRVAYLYNKASQIKSHINVRKFKLNKTYEFTLSIKNIYTLLTF